MTADPRVARVHELLQEIADLKDAIKSDEDERNVLLAELIAEGIVDLGGGVKAIRQDHYKVDTTLARDLIPTIYDALVDQMQRLYDPVPTKADLEKAIAHLPADQREAILAHIRTGESTPIYTVRRGRA